MSKHDLFTRPFPPATPWEMLRFESPEAGGAPAVADPAPADPAPADTAPADPAPTDTAPAATTPQGLIDPSGPEFQALIDGALEARMRAMGADAAQGGQPDDGGFALDPFDENYGTNLTRMVHGAIQQAIAPIMQQQQAGLEDQGKGEILSQFGTMGDLGEFDREAAFARAQELYGQYAGTYGERFADASADRIIREAAQTQASYEKQIEERGVARYKAELAAAAGNGAGDLGVGGGAAPASAPANSYDEVVNRWVGRTGSAGVQL